MFAECTLIFPLCFICCQQKNRILAAGLYAGHLVLYFHLCVVTRSPQEAEAGRRTWPCGCSSDQTSFSENRDELQGSAQSQGIPTSTGPNEGSLGTNPWKAGAGSVDRWGWGKSVSRRRAASAPNPPSGCQRHPLERASVHHGGLDAIAQLPLPSVCLRVGHISSISF